MKSLCGALLAGAWVLLLCAVSGVCGSDVDGEVLKPWADGEVPKPWVSTKRAVTLVRAITPVAVAATVLMCPMCQQTFKKGRGMASHFRCNPEHSPTSFTKRKERTTPRTKKKYTFRQKRDRLLEYDKARKDPQCTDPLLVVSAKYGIPTSTLQDWIAKRLEIFTLASTPGMANKHKNRATADGKHAEAEHMLYMRFVWRRRYLRRRVSRKWLRRQMRDIVKATTGKNFGASPGWCSRFCRRWDITYQGRTNKHTDSILERLPLIRTFHRWLIYGLQRSMPQRCAKYGRFPPSRMYHMDQVPMPFSAGTKKTMNMRGEQCAVKEPGGASSTKRMCTLQVTVCAEPNKQLPLEIIFKNKSGSDEHLTAEERAHYASLPNIRVRWQKSAWADESIMLDYFRDFRLDTINDGEVLLGMDRHGSQKTTACRAFMALTHIVPAFTPPNCTDCTSPVDHHIGQTLKTMIADKYDRDYERDEDSWHLPKKQGGLGDARKRMLVAQWASEAWAEFKTCPKRQQQVRDAFVKTGFLIAADGSENHLIELARGSQFDCYWF